MIKSSEGLEGTDLRRAVGHFGAAAVETMIADIPTVSKVEEFAEKVGLSEVKTESATEVFEYDNGAAFVASPLVSDFLMPVWLDMLDEQTADNVTQKLAGLM